MTADEVRRRIAARLRGARRVAVTSHQRPDGDSLCTAFALKLMGEKLGLEVSLINADNTPIPFSQFPEAAWVRIGQIDPSGFDTVILLECADVSRSGQENLGAVFKVNIDHHYSNTPYADLNWIDPEAPAVGEMVHRLGLDLGVPPTPEIAEHLYCAIASDTGGFQFSNTTDRALETCAALVRAGADPVRVSEKLFGNVPAEKMILTGRILSRLTFNERRDIAVISLFKADLESLNLKEVDLEDVTSLARSIRGVRLVLFFKEMAPETFRVSMRSKGSANAALIAERFGGGGHVHASGFTVQGPYDELIRDVPAMVEELLKKQDGGNPA